MSNTVIVAVDWGDILDRTDPEGHTFWDAWHVFADSDLGKSSVVKSWKSWKLHERHHNEFCFSDSRAKQATDIQKEVDAHVKEQVDKALNAGQRVGVVGGWNKIAPASIQAHREFFPEMSVLHFGAVPQTEGISTSLGARLVTPKQQLHADASNVSVITDTELHDAVIDGEWRALVRQIALEMRNQVYISFDVTAFESWMCPNSPGRLPGGLSWHQVQSILEYLSKTKEIVGFDLCGAGSNPFLKEMEDKDNWSLSYCGDDFTAGTLLRNLVGYISKSRSAK